MSLTDENGMGTTMLVQPSGYANNGGFGDFGGNGFWILLLFLLLGGNGWGNGWGNGFGGGFGGNAMADMYPWMNQQNQINDGFRDQMLNTTINGIQNSITSGFGDVQNALCSGFGGVNMNLANGFAGVNASIANGFAQAEISNNARQIADMQQNFAAQTATMQGFNGVQSGLADVRYTEATEACATRTASAQNTRDIIDAQNRGTQAILDKLCALELDGVKGQLAAAQRENVGLQNQLNMANLAASQTAQTAQILAGQTAEIDGVYNRLKNCPVPSMPVYGNQPIFTCGNANGCGCGVG